MYVYTSVIIDLYFLNAASNETDFIIEITDAFAWAFYSDAPDLSLLAITGTLQVKVG